MSIDLGARRFKYLASAAVQGAMLYLWFKPCIKTNQIIEGTSVTKTAEEFSVQNNAAAVNILFIALSILGALLFLLPTLVTDKRFSRMIDIPLVAAVFLGVACIIMCFNNGLMAARRSTEYGTVTECSFTFLGVLFIALAALQIFICIVCRLQARKEKLLA